MRKTPTGSCLYRWKFCHRDWVGDRGFHLYSTHKDEWARNRARHKSLNDMGEGRPIARIQAENSGLRAKDSAGDEAGGHPKNSYLRMGALRVMISGVFLARGRYNGASGTVVDIVYRCGGAAPEVPPGFRSRRFLQILRGRLSAGPPQLFLWPRSDAP